MTRPSKSAMCAVANMAIATIILATIPLLAWAQGGGLPARDATSLLLEYGPLGLIVLALGAWTYKRENQWTTLQETRVTESKEMIEKYHLLMEESNKTVAALTAVLAED